MTACASTLSIASCTSSNGASRRCRSTHIDAWCVVAGRPPTSNRQQQSTGSWSSLSAVTLREACRAASGCSSFGKTLAASDLQRKVDAYSLHACIRGQHLSFFLRHGPLCSGINQNCQFALVAFIVVYRLFSRATSPRLVQKSSPILDYERSARS